MTGLEIDILGQFALRRHGADVPVPSARQRALLTLLALRAGQVVPGHVLASAVWGETPPTHVRASLSTVVYRLRSLLGEGTLRTAATGYRLDIAPEKVDALRFQNLLDAASSARGDEETLRLLKEALGLWRGAPLADGGSRVIEAQYANGLTERYLGAVEYRTDLELRLYSGSHRELIATLRELTAHHPFRESLWQRLLTALDTTGRQAEALEAYEGIRRLLDDELGARPSAELRALHTRLLRAERGAVPPPAPPSTARRGARVPRRLPPSPDGFVGRTGELAALEAAAQVTGDSGRAAIAVVHGTGGIGKTSLVVRWAHRVADRFPDGRLLLDLRGYGAGAPLTPHHALGVLLAGLGVHRDLIPADTDERRALWPEVLAGRRFLLVLDNALSVEQVRPLLPGPGGTVVITSRNRLSGLTIREGARSVPLPEMSVEESRRLLGGAVGPERAAAEPEALDRLAGACGRLPLALRVVAELLSRHPDVPLAHFAGEFTRDGAGTAGLDALAVADDPASDPRTVFSWSYRELDAAQARLFRMSSLVPGGRVGAAEAAALTSRPLVETRAALAALAALHLLEEESPGRYRAHDLLREYAVERATAEESPTDLDAALERLLQWYLHATAAAVRTRDSNWFVLAAPTGEPPAPVPDFGGDTTRASDWLDEWCADLVAAVTRTAAHGHGALGVLIADQLRPYYWVSLRMPEWEATAEAAMRAAEAYGDASQRGAARLCLADFHAHGNRPDLAVPLYREAGALAARSGRPDLQAASLNNLAGVLWRAGRLAESAECLTRVLQLNRRLGRSGGEYRNRSNLATVCLRLGRTQEAYDHLVRALELARTSAERSHGSINLAAAAGALGRFDESLRYARSALPDVRATKDVTWEADCLSYMAEVHRDLGRETEARDAVEAARNLVRRIDDPLINAQVLVTGGTVELRFGNHERAEALCREALVLALDHGLMNEEAAARVVIAWAAAAGNRPGEAAEFAGAALALAREHGYVDREGDALVALARARIAEGNPEKAAESARRAVGIHEAAQRPVALARALFILGRTGTRGAPMALRRALAVFTELGCGEAEDVRAHLNAPHRMAG